MCSAVEPDTLRNAFHIVAKEGKLEVLNILCEFHAKSEIPIQIDQQDIQGWTALSLATRYGHAMMVERLLELGATPNPEPIGMFSNSLMIATDMFNLHIVTMLLEKCSNLNLR